MPAAPDCKVDILISGEVNGRDNVSDIDASRDKCRMFVDHCVVQCPGVIVADVMWLDELTSQVYCKLRNGNVVK
jgi:hypothetical protein